MTPTEHRHARRAIVDRAAEHIRLLKTIHGKYALQSEAGIGAVARLATSLEGKLLACCQELVDYDEEAEDRAEDRADRYEGSVLMG